MARQMVRKVLRFFGFIMGAVLLFPFLWSSPVLAGSLAISPSVTELEMLPGTTVKVMLSVKNGLDRSYTFHFSPVQVSHLKEGYGSFPNLSWFSLEPVDIELAPDERGWVKVELAIPHDENLVGQKWAASIEMGCKEQPLLSSEFIILVSVGKAPPSRTDWGLGGGIVAASVVGAVLWTRWRENQRAEWSTGLKTRDWLE